VIVNPGLDEEYRVVINREKFLRVDGVLQNQDHTISIKAAGVQSICITAKETKSHGFHQTYVVVFQITRSAFRRLLRLLIFSPPSSGSWR
jgi:hypothetical protein